MHHQMGGLRRRAAAASAPAAAVFGGTLVPITGGVGVTVAAVSVLAPAAAEAGTYDVRACDAGSGTGSSDGWSAGQAGGIYLYSSGGCASGQGLAVSLESAVSHSSNARVFWGFNAPANTSIERITAGNRSATVAGGGPGYQPAYAMTYWTSGPADSNYYPGYEFDVCSGQSGCSTAQGAVNYPLPSASAVRFWLVCGGQSDCPATAPNTKAAAALSDITVRLSDESSPQVGTVSGSLQSDATFQGAESLSIAATDAGGGVKDAEVLVDGAQRALRVLDDNSGKCAAPFHFRVPCKLVASGDVTLDTRTVTDGVHSVQVRVYDAAGNATGALNRSAVVFDNAPPSVTNPNLTGSPVVGETLTCAATVIGQSPTVSYKWFRSAPDGSDEVQITGASASSYTLTAADTARKVLCQVSGSDGGGTASAKTTLTTPPFAGGVTVTGSADEKGAQAAKPAQPEPAIASAAPASNGTNAGLKAVVKAVWIKGGSTRLTSRFNGAPSLRGKVTNAVTGQPIGGAIIDVTARPAYPGARTLQMTGVKTRDDGTFLVKVPLGVSSRQLQLTYRPVVNGPEVGGTAALSLVVRAGISLRSVRSLGRTLTLSGRLAGGPYPKVGPVVEVQVKKGATWQVFATGRAGRTGQFTLRYQSSARLPRGQVFVFRARLRPSAGYPYAGGTSAPRRFTAR